MKLAIAVFCVVTSLTPAAGTVADDSGSLMFRALTWRELGPFGAGRSVAVAGSTARPFEYYTVRLAANGHTLTRPAVITKDPRSTATIGDLKEQLALARTILDSLNVVNEAVRGLRRY